MGQKTIQEAFWNDELHQELVETGTAYRFHVAADREECMQKTPVYTGDVMCIPEVHSCVPQQTCVNPWIFECILENGRVYQKSRVYQTTPVYTGDVMCIPEDNMCKPMDIRVYTCVY